MSVHFIKLKNLALGLIAIALIACAPVPPREAAISAGIQSNDWKSRQIFSNNINFEQPSKRTRFSNALEMSLRNTGWFTTLSTAPYQLTFELVDEKIPKKFRAGSEGSASVRYILKDRNQTVVMNKFIYTTGKLSLAQSLLGAEGVSEVVEAYANENLKQLFSYLETVGASIYDKQQTQAWEKKTSEAFEAYDVFSSTSFFESNPYSSMSYGARVKLLEATKPSWIKKLKASPPQNCQKFLSSYGPYLGTDDKAEVTILSNPKKTIPNQQQDKHNQSPTKSNPSDYKNPF